MTFKMCSTEYQVCKTNVCSYYLLVARVQSIMSFLKHVRVRHERVLTNVYCLFIGWLVFFPSLIRVTSLQMFVVAAVPLIRERTHGS